MNDPKRKQLIADILYKNTLTVISTIAVNTGNPESALVTYAENENLELYFGTYQNERKYKNLKNNPAVAFVIGWDATIHETLQYEGVARELEATEIHEAHQHFLKKPGNINTEEYLYHPKFSFFIVKPTWLRYSNYLKFELTF